MFNIFKFKKLVVFETAQTLGDGDAGSIGTQSRCSEPYYFYGRQTLCACVDTFRRNDESCGDRSHSHSC